MESLKAIGRCPKPPQRGLVREEAKEKVLLKIAGRDASELEAGCLSEPAKGWSSTCAQPHSPPSFSPSDNQLFRLPTQLTFFFSELWKFKESYQPIPVL